MVLIFDTETTGLVDNRTVKLEQQPYVVEWFSQLVDLDSEKVVEELELLIKPPGSVNEITTNITGITNEMLEGAPTFVEASSRIKQAIESAPMVAAHNASFDVDMTDIEFKRLGQKIAWPRVMCTVEQTVHIAGYRLTLTKLHEMLFKTGFPKAHRARSDVEALTRCLIWMRKAEWI